MTIDEFSPFFPLFISLVITTVVSVTGVLLSRKLGLTPAQVKYVDTLEGLNDVLQKKIDILSEEISQLKIKIAKLETEHAEFKEQESELKQENFELRVQLAEMKRSRSRTRSVEPDK